MSAFCPDCGSEMPDGQTHCSRCGESLHPEGDDELSSSRETRFIVVLLALVPSFLFVVLSYLLGLSLMVEPQELLMLDEETGEEVWHRFILIPVSIFYAAGPMIGFVVAGGLCSLCFRGRYLREVALGLSVAAVTQVAIWLIALGSDIGMFFTTDAHVPTEGGALRIRAFMLFLFFPLVFLFSGLVTAINGWVIVEQMTGKAMCLHCRGLYKIRPAIPRHCPECHVLLETDTVRWPWVFLAAFVTGGCFFALFVFGGESLGFFYHCDPYALSQVCRDVLDDVSSSSSFVVFQDTRVRTDAHSIVFHKWKYLGYMALLMMIAPAVLGVTLRRGERVSSGVSILCNWAMATAVVLFVVARSGGFEATYLWLIRLQLLGLILWGLSGFIGAMVGYSIRGRLGQPAVTARESMRPSHTTLSNEWAVSHRRKRLVYFGIALVVFGFFGGGLGVWVFLAPEPMCDGEGVQGFVDSPEIPPSALHRVCAFPEPLSQALQSMESSPPEHRDLYAQRLTVDAPRLFLPLCHNYAAGFADAARVRPSEKSAAFFAQCDVSHMGIRQQDVSGHAFGKLIIAMAVYQALQGNDEQTARRLVRAIVDPARAD